MPNKRNPFKALRFSAFQKQKGRCFYCELPMWLENPHAFALRHNLTNNQARVFKCTGEHLVAKSSGGGEDRKNIVAACWYCNTRRHRRKTALDPETYKHHVQERIYRGNWITFGLHSRLMSKNIATSD